MKTVLITDSILVVDIKRTGAVYLTLNHSATTVSADKHQYFPLELKDM
jgi:hypothetical protein